LFDHHRRFILGSAKVPDTLQKKKEESKEKKARRLHILLFSFFSFILLG